MLAESSVVSEKELGTRIYQHTLFTLPSGRSSVTHYGLCVLSTFKNEILDATIRPVYDGVGDGALKDPQLQS